MKSLVILLSLFIGTSALADLPRNNLHLQDRLGVASNIDEPLFNKICDTIIALWQPLAESHGAKLTVEKNWKDSTVNAYASQSGKNWKVAMFGGLARRPEITPDGFAMVVCHELGHHFGGFSFYGNMDWAAAEGQSDYFATQVCAREVFKKSVNFNRRFRADVPAVVKQRCDASWSNPVDQDICYRASAAGYSLANLLATIGGGGATPKFETPDPRVVTQTSTSHPAAQCRLDTYFSGALCPAQFDLRLIPGRHHPKGQGSPDAERDANRYSCSPDSGYKMGLRPACWYKSQLTPSFGRGRW